MCEREDYIECDKVMEDEDEYRERERLKEDMGKGKRRRIWTMMHNIQREWYDG